MTRREKYITGIIIIVLIGSFILSHCLNTVEVIETEKTHTWIKNIDGVFILK